MEGHEGVGIRAKDLKQYLARYLFLKQAGDQEVHTFSRTAATLYPPLTGRTAPPIPAVPVPAFDDTDSDPEDPD